MEANPEAGGGEGSLLPKKPPHWENTELGWEAGWLHGGPQGAGRGWDAPEPQVRSQSHNGLWPRDEQRQPVHPAPKIPGAFPTDWAHYFFRAGNRNN